jgi:hypothetical protein
MPLVHPCRRQGCRVLTMGEFCIHHESPQQREAPAVNARVEVRSVTAIVPVRSPLYSASGENGQA